MSLASNKDHVVEVFFKLFYFPGMKVSMNINFEEQINSLFIY